MSNSLRIIGGQWRSRQISFDDAPGLRPTPARVRETLFNWLQFDIANSRCLDLFAGSGALGFEAASRGAQQVVQVENNPVACAKLRANAQLLKADTITLVSSNALDYLHTQAQPFDVVFLDPPFGQQLIDSSCRLLEQRHWLADQAKIYIELERHAPALQLPAQWQLLKDKHAGEVRYCLAARSGG